MVREGYKPQFAVGQLLVGKRPNFKHPYILIREIWDDSYDFGEGDYFYSAHLNANVLDANSYAGSFADEWLYIDENYKLYFPPYVAIWNDLNI